MTPSDQADATSSSAKRPAAIPTQRSGRALRLLVLGTGDDAAAFKERAARAGAELAQRFSVRVTHVVVGDGIGEQDARLVRAQTAGVPVLGLADGDRLLNDAEQADPGEASGDATLDVVGMPGEVPAQDTRPEDGERSGENGMEGAQGEAGACSDEPGHQSGTDDEDRPTGSHTHTRVLSLIPPRTEFSPEPSDVRPSDVFTDSALETVLHFPPLRTATDVDADTAVDDTGLELGATGLPDKAASGCACAHEEALGDPLECERDGDTPGAVEAPVAGAGCATASAQTVRRLTNGKAASTAWALLPLVSIGLLAPVGIGYAAYRMRSRLLFAATVCYTLAVAAACAVSAAAPVRTGAHAASGELLAACLTVPWLGGTVHSFVIRRRVFR